MKRRTLAAIGAVALLLPGCSTSTEPTATPAPSGSSDDHGEIAGAEEVAEPPLHLLTVDDAGRVGLHDLLDETSTDLGRIPAPTATVTDGRYLFATTPEGVEVVDSGLWTWDHGDHFHYYRAEPALVGAVPGAGTPTVVPGPLSTGGGTGIFFRGSGEAVLLDNEALSEGRLQERFRLPVGAHDGLVAPLGDGAVLTVPDGSGAVTAVRRHLPTGAEVPGSEERCRDPRGSITTAVGLVVGCADGALLWTGQDETWTAERIPYPPGLDAPRAIAFAAREGRPTVAGLAGTSQIWLLDTRERRWDLLDAGRPLHRVSAADDEEGHVVALDRTGRVRVYLAGSGRQVAVSRPLLRSTRGAELIVDDSRAYLNDRQEDVIFEIDYADRARIARELRPPTAPDHVAEVGR